MLSSGVKYLIKVNNATVSFKASYQMQGSSEALDEICWYLQKSKNKFEQNFDFLDIRLVKKSLNETDKIIRSPNISLITNDKKVNDNIAQMLEEHIMDLIDIRKGVMKPFLEPKNNENIDLFLTGSDKKLAEQKSINMVEDSLSNVFNNMNFADKAKLLLKNLSQMREGLYKGKPISVFKPSVVQKYLPHLNLRETPVLKAEDVLCEIKQGSFDVFTGLTKA